MKTLQAFLAALFLLVSAVPAAPVDDAARQYFTDTVLVDQHGEDQRFYSDLLDGKVVVINTFFTSCKGICPVITAKLAKVQEWLGDRLGSEVHMVSISVDPENDTQEAVARYAEQFGARQGWYFLTGDGEDVRFLLSRLGEKTGSPEDHASLLYMGNVPTELWKKVQGLSEADEIVEVLGTVIRDEG
jgi:cytochrome oxidase Cu insertion factor (SCO1/SenC/PrrC family)